MENTTRVVTRLLACAAVAGPAAACAAAPAAAADDATAQAAQAGWHFAPSVSAHDRAVISSAVASYEPGIRRLFDEVAPLTTIDTHRGSQSLGGTSGLQRRPYLVDFATQHLHNGGYARHAIAHELGHVLDDAGVGPRTMRAFRSAARRSPRYRSCFVTSRGGCAPQREIFADQVAYAATGGRRAPTGYHDPPLLSTARMVDLLAGFTPRG